MPKVGQHGSGRVPRGTPQNGSSTLAKAGNPPVGTSVGGNGETPTGSESGGSRVFPFLGIPLKGEGTELHGDCVLCGRDGRFFVDGNEGLWQCKKCGASGNPLEFVRRFYALCQQSTSNADLAEFADDRKLISPDTLSAWGVCKSVVTDEWLVPGYSADGTLCQMYRRTWNSHDERYALWACPGIGYGSGIHLPSKRNESGTIYVCEGYGDGIILWEAFEGSLDVVAVPGAGLFHERWSSLFEGKKVVFLFDNDHPKPNKLSGELVDGASIQGTKRAAGILKGAAKPPAEMQYLWWGKDGYNPDKPDGYDIKDHLGRFISLRQRRDAWVELSSFLTDCPKDWPTIRAGSEELVPLKCESWTELLKAWRNAMEWSGGLEKALSCMLASVVSTEGIGEQLWLKVMGPPSCIGAGTHIKFVVREPNGKLVCKKGASIKRLYERFNNLPQTGGGTRWKFGCEFFVPSVNEDYKIVLNKIQKVLSNGVQETYKVRTASGLSLEATADHEFLTDDGYKKLSDIKVGDTVHTNPGVAEKKGRNKQKNRKEVCVKYHPTATTKVINGCKYHRLREYHLVYEAYMNNMSTEAYRKLLNTPWKVGKIWTVPEGYEIHHKDENPCNNHIDNLELMKSGQEHRLTYHMDSTLEAISIHTVLDSIVAITPIGKKQVYDIVCSDPYRNFSAGGVIVHNCGKTTLCEALSVCKKHIYAKSNITGLHSGYKSDKEGVEDHSLIPKIANKTFIIKDGDTLLRQGNVKQILSELRDFFDGTSRAHYRHGLNRDYENIRSTMILCGTSSLRELDSSELGARYLDVVIMEGVNREIEKKVTLRVVDRAFANMGVLANGKAETRQDAKMVKAKRLTGGYVEYLRANADLLLSKINASRRDKDLIVSCAEFVAYMRARPSGTQNEVAEREFSARLVEQFARLAGCLCAVTGRKTVTGPVADIIRQVAIDTARGRCINVVKYLMKKGKEGSSYGVLSTVSGEDEKTFKPFIQFLRRIKVLETYFPNPGVNQFKYRVTKDVADLYQKVMVNDA